MRLLPMPPWCAPSYEQYTAPRSFTSSVPDVSLPLEAWLSGICSLPYGREWFRRFWAHLGTYQDCRRKFSDWDAGNREVIYHSCLGANESLVSYSTVSCLSWPVVSLDLQLQLLDVWLKLFLTIRLDSRTSFLCCQNEATAGIVRTENGSWNAVSSRCP